MKNKLLFSLLFVAFAATTTAQDIIVTKQSERIDAKILEISPTEIRYKRTDNPDGPTYVLPKEKVASVVYANGGAETFEEENPSSGSGASGSGGSTGDKTYHHLYRGLEVSLNFGANVLNSALGYAAGFQPGISIGRRFNEHMYLGISGAYIPGAETAPVYATVRSYVPIGGGRMEFITDVSLGYIIEGHGDPLMFTAVPGLQIPLNSYMDIRVGAGALLLYLIDDSEVAFMSTLNASIAFHNSTDPLKSVKKPTLYNGLQIGGEIGVDPFSDGELGFGIDIAAVLSYKLSPKLSFGVGGELALATDKESGTIDDGSGPQSFSNSDGHDYTRFFLRGKYNLSTGKYSPFASLDLGLRSSNYGYHAMISPAIGLSFSVGSNGTLDIKAQYDWVPAKPALDDYTSHSYQIYDRSLSLSHFFLKLGFTQTLNVLSDRKYSDTVRDKLKMGVIMD